MQDYTKDLSILLTGSGKSTRENTATLLEDYIFGSLDNREVKIIVPYATKINPSLAMAIKWCESQGITGMDFTAIAEPDIEHITQESAGEFIQVEQGESLDKALELLFQEKETGREVVMMSIYNPDSAADLSDIQEAKNNNWLTTLNLSEGLVDFFDGYESSDDRIKRETLEEAFAEQQRAKEESAPVKKTTAKKATTPRKRAASKAVREEPTTVAVEPEKPVVASGWAPHEHKFVWFDDERGKHGQVCECGELEPDSASTELSGTIVMGPIPPALPADTLKLITSESVWQDVARAVPTADSVMVKRDDLVQIGNAMENMAVAFSEAMSVFTKILKEN